MWSIYLALLAKNAHELCEVNISYTGVLMVIIIYHRNWFFNYTVWLRARDKFKNNKKLYKTKVKFMTRAS